MTYNFLVDLVQAKNEQDIRTALTRVMEHAGLSSYALAYRCSGTMTVWHNFPNGWDGVGEPGMRERDPVALRVLQPNAKPVIWGKQFYEEERAIDHWDEFSSKGIRSGIDSVVANPHGNRLVLTLAGDQDDLPRGEELIRQLNTTMTAASCFSAVVPGIVTAEQFVADLSVAHFDLLRFLFEGQSLEALARRYHQTEAFIGRQLASLAQRAGFQHPLSTALFAIRGAA
ncbi:autoinducer binding domain-containing protein [Parachitinimonas caeni]|uniref:Autoinducer binding domain-containing protein n=1 Tax=Parachitinimonas caeni TaxID=3031301 RepID=A0ABT7DSH4_9NEIS|nr:autoinducer binding domain-containing protein [Parachitinimonas caeni]MDK2122724.1 autoinducer binding domain-containing protein [Parachitinimonas caeni]